MSADELLGQSMEIPRRILAENPVDTYKSAARPSRLFADRLLLNCLRQAKRKTDIPPKIDTRSSTFTRVKNPRSI